MIWFDCGRGNVRAETGSLTCFRWEQSSEPLLEIGLTIGDTTYKFVFVCVDEIEFTGE